MGGRNDGDVTAPIATPPTTLDAGDLTLVAWQPSDAARALDAVRASLPELAPWMPWATDAYDLAATEDFLRRTGGAWLDGTAYGYALVATDDPDGTVLGSAGLHRRIGPGALEIGYWVHSAHTRRGIATRAAAVLTRAALDLADTTTVEIHHDVTNAASGAVPKRLGYTLLATVDVTPEAPAETGRRHHWQIRSADYPASPIPALLGGDPPRGGRVQR